MGTPLLLILVLILDSASSHRLSEHENSLLQQSCGLRSARKNEHKVLGGVRARAADFPWAAKVSMDGFLTASVISPRHVILFNLAYRRNDDVYLQEVPLNSSCVGSDLILSGVTDGLIDVNFITPSDGSSPNIEKIIVLDGCDRLNTYNPMILELGDDLLFDKTHSPICVSTSPDEWSAQEELTVFGLSPEARRLTSAKFAPKTCGFRKLPKEVNCARPLNQSHGLCAGDFGGGAVAEIDGKATLLGVFAEGNTLCSKSPEKHRIPEFINIGYYAEAICERIGVCAGVPATSTEEPELPELPDEEEGSGASPEEPTETTPLEEPEGSATTSEELFLTTTASTSSDSLQVLIAETFEKLMLSGALCSNESNDDDDEEEVHIHIHLDSESDSDSEY